MNVKTVSNFCFCCGGSLITNIKTNISYCSTLQKDIKNFNLKEFDILDCDNPKVIQYYQKQKEKENV